MEVQTAHTYRNYTLHLLPEVIPYLLADSGVLALMWLQTRDNAQQMY